MISSMTAGILTEALTEALAAPAAAASDSRSVAYAGAASAELLAAIDAGGGGGSGPFQAVTKLGVSTSSFTDDVVDGICVLLYAPIPLGAITAYAAIADFKAALSAIVSSLSTGASISFLACMRNATAQPSVTPAQFANAGTVAFSINLAIGSTGTFGTNSANAPSGFAVGGVDSYGNSIGSGSALALDIGFVCNQLKANQSAVVNVEGAYFLSLV